jgi:hypothetical protein
MKFGIFLDPFHRVGEKPTLALDRDREWVQWLDSLGCNAVWMGERHSAGWEIICLEDRCGWFGGFLVQTIDWTPHDQMLHSDELPARYVMPQFQGTALGTAASNT